MNSRRVWILLSAAIPLAAASAAQAQNTAAPPASVESAETFDSLVAEALRANPQLATLRARWLAARQSPAQAHAMPNPMVWYREMNMADESPSADTAERRIEIEQTIPWFGKRALRSRVAEQDADAMRWDYEAMAREVRMRVQASLFELGGVEKSLAILRAEADVLAGMVKSSETRYTTGQTGQQDLIKAQAESSMLAERLYTLEARRRTIVATLNALLHRDPDAPLRLAAMPPARTEGGRSESLLDRARKEQPEVRRAQSLLAGSERRRDLMAKEYYPDLVAAVEYRANPNAEDMAMLSLGVELPIWAGKNRAAVAEAERMRDAARAALEGEERQAELEVQSASFQVLAAQRTLELYEQKLVPQAELRFRSSAEGYQAGTVDFMDLLESERFLLNARLMQAMAEAELGMQQARLERAAGGKDIAPGPANDGKD